MDQSDFATTPSRFPAEIERFQNKRVRAQPRLTVSFVCTGYLRISGPDSEERYSLHLEMPLQNPRPGREVEMIPFPESRLDWLQESNDPAYDFILRGAIFGRIHNPEKCDGVQISS
jgi:hypothetical protein